MGKYLTASLFDVQAEGLQGRGPSHVSDDLASASASRAVARGPGRGPGVEGAAPRPSCRVLAGRSAVPAACKGQGHHVCQRSMRPCEPSASIVGHPGVSDVLLGKRQARHAAGVMGAVQDYLAKGRQGRKRVPRVPQSVPRDGAVRWNPASVRSGGGLVAGCSSPTRTPGPLAVAVGLAAGDLDLDHGVVLDHDSDGHAVAGLALGMLCQLGTTFLARPARTRTSRRHPCLGGPAAVGEGATAAARPRMRPADPITPRPTARQTRNPRDSQIARFQTY